jgi:hypothetical protein
MKCAKCDLKAVGRGLCSTHYARARRRKQVIGEPMPNKNCEDLEFRGIWTVVRLRLTPLDVLGQRGSACDEMPVR